MSLRLVPPPMPRRHCRVCGLPLPPTARPDHRLCKTYWCCITQTSRRTSGDPAMIRALLTRCAGLPGAAYDEASTP